MIVFAHIYVPIEVDDKFEALRPAIRKHLPIDFADKLKDELLEIYNETVKVSSATVPDFNIHQNGVKITDDDEDEIFVQI